ncbi:Hint domain-containing protein [uncultured Roseobacter sp.]|uniref:Hint domain-containing protein n=1 Tax=uncultured Roseobacter sp. TaxID=114847 RepID=UPI00261F7D07|nr:Hint domain-containing protein [uncultured Roseobacter sp.]
MSTQIGSQSVSVLRGADIVVVSGVNEAEGLSFASDLVMDDVYRLQSDAQSCRLTLIRDETDAFRIADTSEVGTPGAKIHLDCALTLMSPDAPVTEVIVLVQIDDTGEAEDIFALPLAPLLPLKDYHIVGLDTLKVSERLAQVACVSFARGTNITMASGRQRPIETLRPGDAVLTRDEGMQKIRWVGQSTQRAVGDFAPICIAAGALNNTRDLLVSPDHRLFIYQRTDRLGAGRPEVLVKARHLVNGKTVTVQHGGFVEYFQLLFDNHQIIYAEGIAAESMLVDDRTAPLLSRMVTEETGGMLPARHRSDLKRLDVQEQLLDHPDAAEVLRRASLR